MKQPFELVIFVCVMAWIAMIMLSDGPKNRIDMICKPVEWSGRVAASVASLGTQEAEDKTAGFFVARTKDCHMIVFKQFYQAKYEELLREKAAEAKKATEDAKGAVTKKAAE